MKTWMLVVKLLWVSGLSAQDPDSLMLRRIADNVLLHGTAFENLRTLTKQVGHRLAGSDNMVKAEAWGYAALKAAGADSVWMQPCMVPHWIRGGHDKASATLKGSSKKLSLAILALGNSIGTANTITAPVILVQNFDELEQKRNLVDGKIVFFNYGFNPVFINPSAAYADAVRYRTQGASRAARYGAIAVLIRSMTDANDNYPHTGSVNYNDSFPKIPAAALGIRDADRLQQWLQGGEVIISIKTGGKMLPDKLGHNVIGELKGSVFPDEYITVGGHLDSWDVGEGAHDDGAGCVHAIEVLRALKAVGYKPRRTLRVVLFANEENGLRGGNQYAQEAKRKREKHLFALESDAGGFTPRGFDVSASPVQLEALRRWLPLLFPYGTTFFNSGGGGADIGPLRRELQTAICGFHPDRQRYFDVHHSAADVLDAVNERELLLGSINMACLLYLVDKYGLPEPD